ncbi:MAG TPA: trehalose-phosphatase, partial [Ktedonobacterales bacterium]|nr:trehalose-phosphatase [Ktedonobacterales bacterium]
MLQKRTFAGISTALRRRLHNALSSRPCGLLSDIDGTLSPIAPTPGQAVLLPEVAEELQEASHVFAIVAAISGRAASDARRLVGLDEIIYIGNHGLEQILPERPNEVQVLPEAAPYAETITAILRQVGDEFITKYPEIIVEAKGVSGSIHVRQTANPLLAEHEIAARLEALAAPVHLRVTRGKAVVELRAPLQIDKGTSVTQLVELFALKTALYLGDDRTDIDAFRALRALTAAGRCEGFAVAVLHPEAPPDLADEADIVLPTIDQVPQFL